MTIFKKFKMFVSYILVDYWYKCYAFVGQNWFLPMLGCCVIMRLKYVLLLLGK